MHFIQIKMSRRAAVMTSGHALQIHLVISQFKKFKIWHMPTLPLIEDDKPISRGDMLCIYNMKFINCLGVTP